MRKVTTAVAQRAINNGMLICESGINMNISANKVTYLMATLCSGQFLASIAHQHKDRNVMPMGGSVIGELIAKQIIKSHLSNEFRSGKHARNVAKILSPEKGAIHRNARSRE